jgi:cobaltochelatase CobS
MAQISTSGRKAVPQKMADVFDISVPDHVMVPVYTDRTPNVPQVDDTYTFERVSLKKVLQWLDGSFGKNLLLTGPTGCGKSSLIEQVCARLNIEVWRVGAHGKLEFPELLGSTQLVPGAMANTDGLLAKAGAAISALFKGTTDGESVLQWLQRSFSNGVVTRFVYGPAVLAAQRGGVLLMDEANFLHPSTVGAFNTTLDGGTLLIPDTGEVIVPASAFRICFTGNAMDGGDDMSLHRGIQRMNVALMNRFLSIRCDYMNAVQEAAVIGKTVDLPGDLVSDLLSVAADTRKSFKDGAIETTISTRVLVRWAKLIQAQKYLLPTAAESVVTEALNFALLDAANPVDAAAINLVLKKTLGGKTFTVAPQPVTPSQSGQSPSIVNLYVSNEDPSAPKYWGTIEVGNGTESVFYAVMGANPTVETKVNGYHLSKRAEKLRKHYVLINLPGTQADPMNVVMRLTGQYYNQLRQGSIVSIPDQVQRNAMQEVAMALAQPTWISRLTA